MTDFHKIDPFKKKYIKYKKKYIELESTNNNQYNEQTGGNPKLTRSNSKLEVPFLYTYLDSYLNPNFGSNFTENYKNLKNIFTSEIPGFQSTLLFSSSDVLKYLFDSNSNQFKLPEFKSFIIHTPITRHSLTIFVQCKDNKTQYTIINSGLGINQYHNNKETNQNSKIYNLWKTYNCPNYKLFMVQIFIYLSYEEQDMSSTKFNYNISTLNLDYMCQLTITLLKNIKNMEFGKRQSRELEFLYEVLYISQLGKLQTFGLQVNAMTRIELIPNIPNIESPTETHKECIKNIQIFFNSIENNSIDFYTYRSITLEPDGNIYTNPQKAGSCAWFCLLWSFFYYFLQNKMDAILPFLKQLTEYFKQKRIEIFNSTKYYENTTYMFDLLRYNIQTILQHHEGSTNTTLQSINDLTTTETNIEGYSFCLNNPKLLKKMPAHSTLGASSNIEVDREYVYTELNGMKELMVFLDNNSADYIPRDKIVVLNDLYFTDFKQYSTIMWNITQTFNKDIDTGIVSGITSDTTVKYNSLTLSLRNHTKIHYSVSEVFRFFTDKINSVIMNWRMRHKLKNYSELFKNYYYDRMFMQVFNYKDNILFPLLLEHRRHAAHRTTDAMKFVYSTLLNYQSLMSVGNGHRRFLNDNKSANTMVYLEYGVVVDESFYTTINTAITTTANDDKDEDDPFDTILKVASKIKLDKFVKISTEAININYARHGITNVSEKLLRYQTNHFANMTIYYLYKPYQMDSVLFKFLRGTNRIYQYTEETAEFLITIRYLVNYKSNLHDQNYLLSIITIDAATAKIARATINDYDVVLDCPNYKFLNYCPLNAKSFVLTKNNKYYLLLLNDANVDNQTAKMLTDETHFPKTVLLLEVGNSFCHLNFKSKEEYEALLSLYAVCGCNEFVRAQFPFTQYGKDIMENLARLINYKFDPYDPIATAANIKEELQPTTDMKFRVVRDISDNGAPLLNDASLATEIANIQNELSKIMKQYNPIPMQQDDQYDYVTFQKTNPKCSIDTSSNLSPDIHTINTAIDALLQIIAIPDEVCSINKQYQIMQLNILKQQINTIKNKTTLDCSQIAEINLSLKFNVDKRKHWGPLYMKFELMFGYIIRDYQWDFFQQIIESFENKSCEIFQLAMGKGKSSVILPLLCLYFTYKVPKSKIYIIIPQHLIVDMEKRFEIFKLQFNIKDSISIVIMSDHKAKEHIIERTCFTEKDIMLFDEIDYQYDPLKSIFNISHGNEDTPFDKTHIDAIVKLLESLSTSSTATSTISEEIIREITEQLNNSQHIYNETYGMSKITLDDDWSDPRKITAEYHKRHVIPYERKDTPLEGSKFSSLLLSLILTVRYFHDKEYQLDNQDVENIYKCLWFMQPGCEQLRQELNIDYAACNNIEGFKSTVKDHGAKGQLVKLYLEHIVLTDITYTDTIKNCSFIDVMNYPCLWKTGFSGTVNVDFKYFEGCTFTSTDKTTLDVHKDDDEVIGVKFAVEGNYQENTDNEFTIIVNRPPATIEAAIFNHIQQSSASSAEGASSASVAANPTITYNCLIDIDGIFRDYDNKTVVETIQKFPNYTNFTFVYFDANDNKFQIHQTQIPESFTSLNALKDPTKTFVYYSQRQIIGIDIANQPATWRGLAVVSDTNLYTSVAQGIFRMRKLNKGQIIDFWCIQNHNETFKDINSLPAQKQKFLTIINENEKTLNKSKAKYLDLQIAKFRARSHSTNENRYIQPDMKPSYLRRAATDTTDPSLILKNQLSNTLNNCKSITIFNDYYKHHTSTTDISSTLNELLFGGTSTEKEKKMVTNKNIEQLQILSNVNTKIVRTPLSFILFEDIDKYCMKLLKNNEVYIMPEIFTYSTNPDIKTIHDYAEYFFIVMIKKLTTTSSSSSSTPTTPTSTSTSTTTTPTTSSSTTTSSSSSSSSSAQYKYILINRLYHEFDLTVHPVFTMNGECINKFMFSPDHNIDAMTKENYIISKYYIQTDLTEFNNTIKNSTWLPFLETIVYNRPPIDNLVEYTDEFIILLLYFKWLKYNTTFFYSINIKYVYGNEIIILKNSSNWTSSVGDLCLKNNNVFLVKMYSVMNMYSLKTNYSVGSSDKQDFINNILNRSTCYFM